MWLLKNVLFTFALCLRPSVDTRVMGVFIIWVFAPPPPPSSLLSFLRQQDDLPWLSWIDLPSPPRLEIPCCGPAPVRTEHEWLGLRIKLVATYVRVCLCMFRGCGWGLHLTQLCVVSHLAANNAQCIPVLPVSVWASDIAPIQHGIVTLRLLNSAEYKSSHQSNMVSSSPSLINSTWLNSKVYTNPIWFPSLWPVLHLRPNIGTNHHGCSSALLRRW